MSQEKVVETFDRWADEGRDKGMEDGHGDVVRQAIAKMEIKPGERILDLGCGNGWATRLLAQTNAGVQAIGVDASPKMIARADELHSFTIRARYDFGSFEDLEFKDGEFDRIFSMEALYYAGDLAKALAEAFRVLKPGGKADILVDYFEESSASESWGEVMGLNLHRKDESGWRAAFEATGFVDVSTERVIDSRTGPDGLESDECSPDDASKKALREAGTLWIGASKPS
jgi:ubiquinone/menaquinone biosynthesis C-methylase UbiE